VSALVEVNNLFKIYRRGGSEVRALDDVSVVIEAGDFTALMGPSGSGKTTLLNIIAGIDAPTSGKVIVDGKDLGAMSESQRTAWRTRSIGYVFQFFNLIPVLTARENVELPLLLLPLSKAQRREHVDTALAAVDLAHRAGHYPRELSGGEEQRVAIARAIVTDARILVADEPTGNLDAASEVGIMELLTTLNARFDKTVILVTHDPSAAAYAKRVLHLEKGKLIREGKEAEANVS
jgi:putative ABC transport system ATP-binding protein